MPHNDPLGDLIRPLLASDIKTIHAQAAVDRSEHVPDDAPGDVPDDAPGDVLDEEVLNDGEAYAPLSGDALNHELEQLAGTIRGETVAAAATPAQPLCEDEGCPHHGTPHICVDMDESKERLRTVFDNLGPNVVRLDVETSHDMPVNAILQDAFEAELTEMVVVGTDPEGRMYFNFSISRTRDIVYLLELAKQKLFEMEQHDIPTPPGKGKA